MVPPALLGVRLHPVQLYEAAGDLVVALGLWWILLATEKGRFKPGLVAALYFIAYAVLRSSLEFVRDDTLPFVGPVTQGQALGMALVAAAVAILAWRRRCSPSC
jgi:prolipoprotein diacylglyceryltransferase